MLQLRNRFLRLRQEFDAAARERHLAGRARDQLDPHLLLELAHAVTDCRLRQVEMRGRFSKAAAFRDAEKGLQAEEVYSHADARIGLVHLYMNYIHQSMRKFHLLFNGIRTMSAPPCLGHAFARALPVLSGTRGVNKMARIIGAIATSHTPTIGFALDSQKQSDPVWKPIFE